MAPAGGLRQLQGRAAAIRYLDRCSRAGPTPMVPPERIAAGGGPPEQLIAAVRAVAAGQEQFAPSVLRRPVAAYVRDPPVNTDLVLDPLTDRDATSSANSPPGASNTEIAAVFYLSPATVKSHVNRIFTKMGLRDMVQAVVLAYECGLVQRGSELTG